MDTILEIRVLDNKDWATVLFFVCFIIIAIIKTSFNSKFNYFIKLLFSDKYLVIYKDKSNLMSWFNISLFIVQLISFTFFIQIVLSYFDVVSKYDWMKFVQIFTLLGFFVLSKFLIGKIIATSFNIEEFADQINLQKVSYRTFIGLMLLPVNVVLFYNTISSINLVYGLILIVLLINAFTYLIIIKMHQNLLFSKIFYFILYLCALEIAPYYFMYYWLTRS